MSNDTLSGLIESLTRLKVSKKSLEKEMTSVDDQIEVVEKQLMDTLDSQGLTEASSQTASIKLGEVCYPHVENWEDFQNWVLENGYLHMYQKRLSATAFREMQQLNRPVPGVVPFTKRKLSFKES